MSFAHHEVIKFHDALSQAVRNDLKQRLGTDLTKPSSQNKLYTTGGAPNMQAGAVKSHRPWDYFWRVAAGTSAGAGRAEPESWERHTERFLRERLFTAGRDM